MFKRTGVFAVAVILALGLVWSEFMTSLILVHNGTATGQGTLVPVRLYRPMKSTGLSDRHLCTQTGDDFQSGEFHVCLDESQFSVSMVL